MKDTKDKRLVSEVYEAMITVDALSQSFTSVTMPAKVTCLQLTSIDIWLSLHFSS